MASKKQSFGTNFKPRAQINGEVESTKNIAFATLSEEDKADFRAKLNTKDINILEDKATQIDISKIVPDKDYYIKKIARQFLKPAPDEWNFFAKPDKNKLILLAESIYKNGLLQPIIVRELDPEGRNYQILAGHTRNEACNILYDVLQDSKYLEIEAMVFPYNTLEDYQAQDIICDTNFMQRGNLPPREMAKCVFLKAKRLKENTSYGQGSIAEKIAAEYNLKRTSVFFWKKLNNLIDELQDIIETRNITLKNSYKLASLTPEEQKKLIEEGLNYISNDALKGVKSTDSLDVILSKIIDDYGVSYKSYRYDIKDTQLVNPKDLPILVFADSKKRKEIIELINKIDGAYVVE